jgi:hypothetical protein
MPKQEDIESEFFAEKKINCNNHITKQQAKRGDIGTNYRNYSSV